MSSDASYTAFLNKANEDPKSGSHGSGGAASTSQSKSKFDPTVAQDSMPASLRSIPATLTYTSDTDSAFEPVALNYASAELPTLAQFKKALGGKGADAAGEELSVDDFDPRGEYAEVVDRVKQAGSGDGVKVFRLELGATRVEYYVVTVGEGKLVGVVAKAVES